MMHGIHDKDGILIILNVKVNHLINRDGNTTGQQACYNRSASMGRVKNGEEKFKKNCVDQN